MELKVNLKTILLFSAFFILSGMILGFYSCSANTTPTTPETTDEQVPVIVTDEGGSSFTTNPGVPGAVSPGINGQGDLGSLLAGYTFTIDANGNVSTAPLKEGEAVSGPWPGPNLGFEMFTVDPGIMVEYSTFTEVGENWEGDVTITNDSPNYACLNPRFVWLRYRVDGFGDTERPSLEDAGLVNADGFCTLRQAEGIFGFGDVDAFPYIFIADEEENYILNIGDSATHQVVLEPDDNDMIRYLVFFVTELAYLTDPGEPVDTNVLITGIPHDAVIELEEDGLLLPTSEVTVRLDIDFFNENRPVIVEVLGKHFLYKLAYEGVDMGRHILTGDIPFKPSLDGPLNLLIRIGPAPAPTAFGLNTMFDSMLSGALFIPGAF